MLFDPVELLREGVETDVEGWVHHVDGDVGVDVDGDPQRHTPHVIRQYEPYATVWSGLRVALSQDVAVREILIEKFVDRGFWNEIVPRAPDLPFGGPERPQPARANVATDRLWTAPQALRRYAHFKEPFLSHHAFSNASRLGISTSHSNWHRPHVTCMCGTGKLPTSVMSMKELAPERRHSERHARK